MPKTIKANIGYICPNCKQTFVIKEKKGRIEGSLRDCNSCGYQLEMPPLFIPFEEGEENKEDRGEKK